MKRRALLQSAPLAALLAACGRRSSDIEIAWRGPDPAVAHRLRTEYKPQAPARTITVDVAIIGGGVAGLSAAWWLARDNKQSLAVLDMQDAPGGNARGGGNRFSAFPMGAHYLPAPGPRAVHVRQLLADLQVIRGDPFKTRPDYDPRMVCFAPQERLWHEGAWQEGLLPSAEPGSAAQAQYEKFGALIAAWIATGSFAMPSALAKRTAEALALDRIAFGDYLQSEGITHPWLLWYLDYCCRDDYGTSAAQTSAFFGVHYFASRHGFGNAVKDNEAVLTWPQGNGWLTAQLAAYVTARQPEAVRTGMLILRVEDIGKEVVIDALKLSDNSVLQVRAKRAVLAVPVFTLPRIVINCPSGWGIAAKQLDYAPWLVANLALSKTPYSLDGTQVAWDNVAYGSQALGYVNAAHQSLAARSSGATTWSWYYAPAHLPPGQARKQLLEQAPRHWLEAALADLTPMHPNIGSLIERVDLTRYGHAMVRPVPGTASSAARNALHAPVGRIMLAHSDLAGYSVFEEANHFGVMAAEWAKAAGT